MQLTMGVQQLDAAAASVSPKQSPIVVITIPYPDPRATEWGTVNGKSLDLSKLEDQVAAVSWFVDYTIKQIAALDLKQAKFGEITGPSVYRPVEPVVSLRVRLLELLLCSRVLLVQ